jgi:hypothetical protein
MEIFRAFSFGGGNQQRIPWAQRQDAAGLHVLMCCAEFGHWQLALELMARHEDVM